MVLVMAATLDRNNEALPLAWGIIPGESEDHWSWFLAHLKTAIPLMASDGMVIISDRDKGLDTAGEHHFPLASHLHCCQHLAANVRARFSIECKKHFWKAAHATTESAFSDALREAENEREGCKRYLESIEPHR
jgi:transposase-like protein